jgi:pimeloyl-ACP methyl ester carboxylesterase
MSTFVLIHGSWHGGWCWNKVVPLLERAGHKVITPDLPGSGQDKPPIPNITLQVYAERVCQVLDTQPEPVILVGHSMAGIVISQAAEYRPEKIKTLVYLAAYLLRDGQSLLEVGLSDAGSLIPPNLVLNEQEGYHLIKDEALRAALYADCSDADVARAKSLLKPQANAPTATPVHVTQENYGRVPRVYIETLQDQTISPGLQKRLYTATPCQAVISMNTSHSPFFSAPEELANHLMAVGNSSGARLPLGVVAESVPVGL